MKGKLTITITIGLTCLILTTVLFIQFKTIRQTDITSLENMREDELRTEISNYKLKNEEIIKELAEVSEKIKEYEDVASTDKQASTLVQKELKKSNDLLGKNQVTGPGVVVTLTDTRAEKIWAEDLILLLNELKLAGAEAISINDQRIVYDSYIADISNTYITINGTYVVSPYVVKAIGNIKYLESGLSKKQYGYIDTKLTEGHDITLAEQESITINKYEGKLNLEYVKEGI